MLPTPVSGCSRVQASGESEGLDEADRYCSKCMNFNRFLVRLVAIATMERMGIANIQAIAAAGFLAASLFSHTVALRLICLALAVLLALVMVGSDVWQQRARSSLLPPASMAFLFWAVWCGLSLLWSLEPERSEKEFRNEIVYAALAYWSCFIAGQRLDLSSKVIAILVCALGLVCLLSVTGTFTLKACLLSMANQTCYPPDCFCYVDNPLLGWNGGPGMHSSILLVAMPCFLGWLALEIIGFDRSDVVAMKRRSVLVTLMGLSIFSAFAIENRTIWIGFLLQGLLLIGFVAMWRKRVPRLGAADTRKLLMLGVGLMVCLVVVAGIAYQRRQGLQSLVGDMRLLVWRESLGYILDQPWLGYGFGRGSLRAALHATFNDGLLWHSHNLFLEVVLQTGLIGLALFLLLLGSLMRAAVRHLRHDTLAVSVLGMVASMIVIGMLIRNMTDMLWVRAAALTFWGTLGLAFGLADRSSAANTVVVKP